MAAEHLMVVKLDDGGTMVIAVEQVGSTLVADTGIMAKLSTITSSIEHVSRDVLDAVRRAGPSKATVELGFGLAVEAGQVVALFGKGKGEASIKVTLEWARDSAGRSGGGSPAVEPAAGQPELVPEVRDEPRSR
jgi:Trypsin-co-occurring domain 1